MSTISIEAALNASHEETSAIVHARLASKGIFSVNLISSPGSGKTTLCESLIDGFAGRMRVAVVEGDIETDIDAQRIRKHGAQAVQIVTKSACHIPPTLLLPALDKIDLDVVDLLIVENVGNLVCPAETPLGEDLRVVALSVTEGDEKPLKYPLIFKTSGMLVITKTDLLPYVRFDLAKVKTAARAVNPSIEILEVSSYTGDGIPALLSRFESFVAAKKAAPRA